MERRKHRRVPAQVQGFLLGNSHEIEAVTLDLSVGGARFDCDLEVYPGKVIRVRLVIPGAEELVSIEDARVQWVGEDTFGVSFQNVRPTELDELEQLIDEYEEAEGTGHAWQAAKKRYWHARTPLADFFSILLVRQCLTHLYRKNIVSLWGELNAPREYGSSEGQALGWCASPA